MAYTDERIGENAELKDEPTEPSKEEFNEVLKNLKQGKAPGPDDICSEFIKNGGPELRERLYELMIQIWRQEAMPEEWRSGNIIPIPKKGDLLKCENYRRITLLNVAYKILTSLILKNIKKYTETEFGDYQNGFRQGRSTVDAIHTIKQITEKCYEQNIEVHIVFIDFKQAFDSLNRDALIEDAKILNIPEKLIRMIKITLERSRAAVITQEGLTNEVEVERGVRQGDGLSATLFNIALEGAIRATNFKGTIIQKSVQLVAYADDIAIVARDVKHLEEAVKSIIKEARKRGLEINETKTKYMGVTRRDMANTSAAIKIGKYTFEEVKYFKYLGVIISNKNEEDMEINQKIQAGYRAFYRQKIIMNNKNLSKKTKLKVYKTTIRPILTYAAENMCLTLRQEEQLKIFERKIIRKIYGGKKINEEQYRRLTNDEIDKILEGENIVRTIKSLRIKWYGHVCRREDSSVIKKIMKWKPQEGRPRGRPKLRWEDQVIKDIKTMKIQGWREKLKHRDEWRRIGDQAKKHNNL